MLLHVGEMMQSDLLSVMRTLPAQPNSQIQDLMVKHLCQVINFAFPCNANTFCRGFAETSRGDQVWKTFFAPCANHMYSFIRSSCVLNSFRVIFRSAPGCVAWDNMSDVMISLFRLWRPVLTVACLPNDFYSG